MEEENSKNSKKLLETQLYTIYGNSEYYLKAVNDKCPNYEMIYIGDTSDHLGTFEELNLESIMKHSEVSPFGSVKEKKTVIDPTVRTAREIHLKNIFLKNGDIVEKCTFEHLCTGPLQALGHKITIEPYKLNIYDKGSFFKVHKDTPSTKNMIGTLIYSLTSDYEGGHLVISHNGNTVSHALKKHEYLFMYANCDHEVKEVTEGTRITLTFKVYNEIDNDTIFGIIGISQENRIKDFIETLKGPGRSLIKEYRQEGFAIPFSNMYPEIIDASHIQDDYFNIDQKDINLLGIDKVLFDELVNEFGKDKVNITVSSCVVREHEFPRIQQMYSPYVKLAPENIKYEEYGTEYIDPCEGGRYCGNDYENDSSEYWFYYISVEMDPESESESESEQEPKSELEQEPKSEALE